LTACARVHYLHGSRAFEINSFTAKDAKDAKEEQTRKMPARKLPVSIHATIYLEHDFHWVPFAAFAPFAVQDLILPRAAPTGACP
jgi:hypothetical protein